MKMHSISTRNLLLITSFVVLGAILFFAVRFFVDPLGIVLRAEIPAEPAIKNPKSPYSDQYTNDKRRLVNDIARKTRWDEDDSEWVLQLLESGWPDVIQPDYYENQSMHEAYKLYRFSLVLVADRLGRSFPVSSEVETEAVSVMMDNLSHPQWYVRHSAIADVFNAGLMSQPQVLSQIQFLAEKDDDERVRRNAQIKLDALVLGDG